MEGIDVSFPHIGIKIANMTKGITVGGFTIAFYGMIIALGMVAGLLIARWQAKRTGQDPDVYSDFAIYGIIFAIIGARLYFVIFSFDQYRDNLLQIFNLRGGGMAIYGGVIGGLGRFLIEGLRTDSLYIISGIRVSQVLSLFLICGGILLYVFFVRRDKTKNVYSGRYIR